jgi:hypothetical protein
VIAVGIGPFYSPFAPSAVPAELMSYVVALTEGLEIGRRVSWFLREMVGLVYLEACGSLCFGGEGGYRYLAVGELGYFSLGWFALADGSVLCMYKCRAGATLTGRWLSAGSRWLVLQISRE